MTLLKGGGGGLAWFGENERGEGREEGGGKRTNCMF